MSIDQSRGDPLTHDHEPIEKGGLTRRDSLLKAGGIAALALGAGVLGREVLETDGAEAAGAGPAAVASGLVTCVLTPEMTEGPYFLEGDKVRRDIREGRPGVPLSLKTTVVDVSSCKPIKGAAVDIWHCDAGGTYSGFAQEGTEDERFLRGIQRTNRNGLATFTTIYPGGTAAGPCTSTSRFTSAGASSTRASCSFPTRSPTPSTGARPTTCAPAVTRATRPTPSSATAAAGRC